MVRTCRGANREPVRTSFQVRTVAKRRARAPRIAICAGRTRFASKGDSNSLLPRGSDLQKLEGIGGVVNRHPTSFFPDRNNKE